MSCYELWMARRLIYFIFRMIDLRRLCHVAASTASNEVNSAWVRCLRRGPQRSTRLTHAATYSLRGPYTLRLIRCDIRRPENMPQAITSSWGRKIGLLENKVWTWSFLNVLWNCECRVLALHDLRLLLIFSINRDHRDRKTYEMGVFLCINLVDPRLDRLFLAIIEVQRWWLTGQILSDISQTFEILKDYDWVRFSPLIESFSVLFDIDNLARVDFYKLLSVDLGKYFRDHWSLSLFLCMNLALSVQILLNLLIN